MVYALSVAWVFSARTYRDKPGSEFLLFAAIGLAGQAASHAATIVGQLVCAMRDIAHKITPAFSACPPTFHVPRCSFVRLCHYLLDCCITASANFVCLGLGHANCQYLMQA